MQLVIIAGGKGTRLKERLGDLPKSMVQIGGKPLLEHQLSLARQHGVTDILILTGHGAAGIRDYFGDGSRWGVNIRYVHETEPLGTAGAVLNAFDQLADTFFVMYGDTMLNVDLERMAAAHPPHAAATLFLHPNDHPHDSDLVEIDDANHVVAFHPYPHPRDCCYRNLVNAALYVLRKEALRPWLDAPREGSVDFAKHLFPVLMASGAHIHGYLSREYIKDAGTPERLDRVQAHLESGRIASGSFETPVPAIFLDRDGTLNVEEGFITAPEQLQLLPRAAEAVRLINQSGWLAVVVTNQPVIARGECTEAELRAIHNRLEWLLGESHAYVDAIYFCPHHPEAGFPGERAELKVRCACRKPGTALIEAATRDMNIDLSRSWMIGDRPGDIQSAMALGIPSGWVQTGFQNLIRSDECRPTAEFLDVLEAVEHIIGPK